MRKILYTALAGLSLMGCEADPGTALEDNINTTASPSVAASFSPADSVIPFPNNLLFTGTTDGTLNIPIADVNDPTAGPTLALNSLDGFSTIAPISTSFAAAIDPATVAGNVRLFKVVVDDFNADPNLVSASDTPTFAVAAPIAELTFGVDFVATVSNDTSLVILPLKPLDTASGYMVVITNGLKDTSGNAFKADASYAFAKQTKSLVVQTGPNPTDLSSRLGALSVEQATALEPLRQLTNAAEAVAVAASANGASPLASNNIILSWSFTTQSAGTALKIEQAELAAAPAPALGSFTALNNTVKGALVAQGVPISNVDIYMGTIDVPYYLSDANPLTGAAENILKTSWKGADGKLLSLLNGKNAVPVKTLSIPLLVSIPQGSAPAGGWPVTIFQHGITRDRTDMMALADTLAGAGRAVVAIDMPLHGVTDTSSPFYQAGKELTFDLDLVTQDATDAITAAVPDSVIDTSGRHFINLASLTTSRDNIRQAVIDLMVLKNAIASIDVDNNTVPTPDLNANKISFIGHSLGGIVGTVFLALDKDVKESVLAMPGGGIAKLLENSISFGPEIVAGLNATAGLTQGSAEFEQFMLAAQSVLGTVDPLNHAKAAADNHNILLFEVVGSNSSLPDQVIPNSAATAPLAGTDPLIRTLGLTQIDTTSTAGTRTGDVVIKFSAGHHGSILTPLDASGSVDASGLSGRTVVEMQTNAATYIATGGTAVPTDTAVVSALPAQ